MYELPWFKTETNIFSNRKIQILLKLPEGDTYFRVWIQLIALAVECNNKGRLEIGENNPMTIQNFSKIMGKSNKKIEKILKKFLELEMLIKEEKGITGIDIAISVILITIFIAMMANLIANININSKEIERKTKATSYAVQEIEKIKALGYISDYNEKRNKC